MKNRIIILLIAFIYFFTNLPFLSQWLYGGDSAEFNYVGGFFAISHAPGYPLYSVFINIYRIITNTLHLPIYFGVVSLIFSTLSIVVLYLFLQQILDSRPPIGVGGKLHGNDKINYFVSFFSALLFGNLFIIRIHSVIPEVFSLNTLLIITMSLVLLLFTQCKKQIYSYFAFFILGLMIAHQHIALLFIPAWYFLIKKDQKIFFRKLKYKFLFLFIGLFFYLYAPFAATNQPLFDFENASTIGGFINLITRASFGTFKAYQGSMPNLVGSVLSFVSALTLILKDFRPLGVIFILIGVIFALKRRSNIFIYLLIQAVIGLFFFFYAGYMLTSIFSAATFEKFLTFVYLSLIPFFALGIKFSYKIINAFVSKYSDKKIIQLFPKLIISIILIAYLNTIYQSSQSTLKLLPKTKDFNLLAQQILQSTPDKSILMINHDRLLFSLVYEYLKNEKQYLREQIYLVNPSALPRNFYRKRLQSQIKNINLSYDEQEKTIDNFLNIIKTNSTKYNFFTDIEIGSELWVPYGMLWRYIPDKKTLLTQTPKLLTDNQNIWKQLKPYRLSPQQNNLLYLKDLNNSINSAYENFALFAYVSGNKTLAKTILADIMIDLKPETVKPQTLTLFMNEKDCILAKYYMVNAKEETFYSSSDDLKTLIKYYGLCNIKPKDPEKLMKMYDDLKKKEDVPLSL